MIYDHTIIDGISGLIDRRHFYSAWSCTLGTWTYWSNSTAISSVYNN